MRSQPEGTDLSVWDNVSYKISCVFIRNKVRASSIHLKNNANLHPLMHSITWYSILFYYSVLNLFTSISDIFKNTPLSLKFNTSFWQLKFMTSLHCCDVCVINGYATSIFLDLKPLWINWPIVLCKTLIAYNSMWHLMNLLLWQQKVAICTWKWTFYHLLINLEKEHKMP